MAELPRRQHSRIMTDEIDPTKLYEWSKIKDTVNQLQRRQRFHAISQQKILISDGKQIVHKNQKQSSHMRQNTSTSTITTTNNNGGRRREADNVQLILQKSLELSEKLRKRCIKLEEFKEYQKYLDVPEIEIIFEQLSPRSIVDLDQLLPQQVPRALVKQSFDALLKQKEEKILNEELGNRQQSERLLFYLNRIKPRFCSVNIEEILGEWAGDLEKLETERSYFQYIFPSFTGEGALEDARVFRKSIEIAERVYKVYTMMLEYFGMELEDPPSGKIRRTSRYLERYKSTFLAFQNQSTFKIKKILQFLNITGFRKYAIQLVKFLHYEIFGINGKHSIQQGETIILKPPPLSALQISYLDWENFGELLTRNQKKQLQFLKEHCLFDFEELSLNSEYFHDSVAAKLLFPSKPPILPSTEETKSKKMLLVKTPSTFRVTRSKTQLKSTKSEKI